MKAKSPEILMALVLGYGVAVAQVPAGTSEATAHVSVEIAPYIAVSGPATVIISLEDHPADSPFAAQVQFFVRANTSQVEFQVACTDLYQAGDPTSPYRIPVAGAGAQITCEHGSPVAGGNGLLPWLRGRMAAVLGQWDQAKRLAAAVLQEKPDLGAAHYLMGQIYEHDRDWEKAAQEYRAANKTSGP